MTPAHVICALTVALKGIRWLVSDASQRMRHGRHRVVGYSISNKSEVITFSPLGHWLPSLERGSGL